MANINPHNIDEKTIKERHENKGEMYRIEGLLFYLEKAIKEGSIKTKNKESAILLNNISTYLGERYKKISERENELDEDLKQKFEADLPKSFM